VPQFAGLLERQLAPFGVHRARRQRRVATLEDATDGRRHDPQRRQPALRIAGLDLLLDDADPRDARCFRRHSDRFLDTIREVVELAVRVFWSRLPREQVDERSVRREHDRIPHIRVDVRTLRQLVPDAPHRTRRRIRIGVAA
jgi:hypothetical protein